jgi:hypothetical protein
MIKTPLSTVIGGAFWTPGATILGSSSKNLSQLIKSLFSLGEQGFAYDPNDLTTLYQDAAGTIPVTEAGQPVGLMLDKSTGLVLGGELFADFNSPIAATLSKTTTPVLVTSTAASGVFGVGRTRLILAKTFKISVSWGGNTNGSSITMQVGGTYLTIGSAVSGTFSGIITTSTPGSLAIYKASSVIGQTFTIESLSIKELAGNHAYQTVSASRPILQRNATTGAYYLAFDGTDDFLQTNSIDFTATDKVSLFAGVRKLSDANVGTIAEFSENANSNTRSFWLLTPISAGANTVSFASRGSAATVASIALL